MQLVEEGKLLLDRDNNEFLDFTIPSAFPELPGTRHRCRSSFPGKSHPRNNEKDNGQANRPSLAVPDNRLVAVE